MELNGSLFERAKNLSIKYREPILYIFFGALTTLVNYAVYLFCMYIFSGAGGFYGYVVNSLSGKQPAPPDSVVTASTAIAWIIAVVFAYLTNRTWVFAGAAKGAAAIGREAFSFFAARFASGILDIGVMWLAARLLASSAYAALLLSVAKLLSNVIVTVINYFLSKFIIFKPAAK